MLRLMITPALVERFLSGVSGQPLREGTRFARQARVAPFIGSGESVSTVVRGKTDDYDVALWSEKGALQHRCQCPSWREPCKHEVAAALVLRQWLTRDAETPIAETPGISDIARNEALEERRVAGRRERLKAALDRDAPFLVVKSPSGFAYRVHLRGNAAGPHSCDCPDFEANRLHTCKHVERVRRKIAAAQPQMPPAHRKAAKRPRIYLHHGEVIEPRLFGSPTGVGSMTVKAAFDATGEPIRPLAADDRDLRKWLASFGEWVEPDALAWLDRRIARRPELPKGEPADLLPATTMTPYPYQVEGAVFLARAGRALLADEMGLGKTGQAILAAAILRRAKAPVQHVTVVCPASLRGGWQEEIRRWLGEDVVLLEGSATDRARSIALRPTWLVTHYEQVLRDHEAHRASPPDLLIIDEAQRVKGLSAQTARVLKSIETRHVFALTGTPLENRLEEAYAIAQLVDQRLLPPLWQVERDHFVRDEKKKHRVVAYQNLGALRSHLAPAFLRRRKEDVALDLPDRVRSISFVPMHPAVEDTYADVMSQVARIANKKVMLPADLERMQRLLVIARRACNGPHMLGIDVDDRRVPKLAELEQVLEDLCLGEGRKVVVFSEWTDMTDRVESLCRRMRLPAFHLHGGVPLKRRPGLIQAFRDQGGPAAFVSTDAGGVGLNLQVADAVVNLDLPWNPARLEQRIARVHRIGSKRTVQEILIVTRDRIEHGILRQYEAKSNALANVWAKDGEDVIAAPGGSGAFRDMVKVLCETTAPEELVPSRSAEELVAPAEPVIATTTRQVAVSPGGKVPSPASAPTPSSMTAVPSVDFAALAQAASAIAPTLPVEHRKSLATVFRALAEALDG